MRAAVLALVLLATTASTARACDCVGFNGDPREELEQAEAAVYGRVLGRRIARDPSGPEIFGDETVRYRFRVLRDYKGNLGRTVAVDSSVQEAACGLPDLHRGRRIALFLYRSRHRWASGLCSITTRARLEAGRKPFPAPDGTPPARLLVGGAFGPSRVAALDASGRLLAYGRGQGETVALAPCPGGDNVLELVDGARQHLVVRSVDTLTAGPRTRLRLPRGPGPWEFADAVECQSADGLDAAITTNLGRLIRVTPAGQRPLARGYGLLAGGRLFAHRRVIDSRTGAASAYGPVPRRASILGLSPDGSKLLAAGPHRVSVLDSATGAPLATTDFDAYDGVWLGDGALAVRGPRNAVFFDAGLARTGRTAIDPSGALAADAGELVVAGGGRFARYRADGEPVGEPVRLFTPGYLTLVSCWPATAATGPAR